jgi:hypothetical protein
VKYFHILLIYRYNFTIKDEDIVGIERKGCCDGFLGSHTHYGLHSGKRKALIVKSKLNESFKQRTSYKEHRFFAPKRAPGTSERRGQIIQRIDTIIADDGIPAESLEGLRKSGIEVILVSA